MPDDTTLDTFRELEGSSFRVESDSGEIELALIEVTVRERGSGDGSRSSFALLFRGPVEPLLQQATYSFSQDRMENRDIFIVPVNQTDEGSFYEAIFN